MGLRVLLSRLPYLASRPLSHVQIVSIENLAEKVVYAVLDIFHVIALILLQPRFGRISHQLVLILRPQGLISGLDDLVRLPLFEVVFVNLLTVHDSNCGLLIAEGSAYRPALVLLIVAHRHVQKV